MFLQVSVILCTGGWLPSMHHRSCDQGVCIRGDRPSEIHGILRDTVNKRAVRILLECFLVYFTDDKKAIVPDWTWLHTFSTAIKTSEALAFRTPCPADFSVPDREFSVEGRMQPRVQKTFNIALKKKV